jgi:hypothetical protein
VRKVKDAKSAKNLLEKKNIRDNTENTNTKKKRAAEIAAPVIFTVDRLRYHADLFEQFFGNIAKENLRRFDLAVFDGDERVSGKISANNT